MAVDIAELGLVVRSDGVVVASNRLEELEQKAKRTETATQRLEKQLDKVGKTMQTLGKGISLFVTAPFLAASIASVRLAVDAEETANKFDVVFRGSIERTEASLKSLTDTIPLTVTEMKALTAQTQDMLVPMGLARSEAAELSVTALKLAADIASFNNVGTDEVLRNIASGLAGQSEPLRKFGIDISKARLESIALSEGLVQVGEEMDKAAEAQALFIAITRDSADAMGDAARTVDATANVARFMARDIRQLQEEIGNGLIPVYRELLIHLRDGVRWFKELSPEAKEFAFKAVAITAAAGPLLIFLGGIVRVLGSLTGALVKLAPYWASFGFHLTKLATLLNPAGALALGLGLVGKLLADKYIEHLENAIDKTGKFTTSLEKLKTAAGISSNLEVLNQEVDKLFGQREGKIAEISAIETQLENLKKSFDLTGTTQILTDQLAALNVEMVELDGNIARQIKLRDDYTARVRDAILAEREAAAASEAEAAAAAAAEAARLAAAEAAIKDAAAFEQLKDALDPAAKAMRELAAARALLLRMKGKIGVEEYERLSKALAKAYPTFSALTDKIDELRTINADVAAELQENFAFLNEVGFQQQADSMQQMIDALQGGEEAWDAYQKAMYQAQEVAKLGPEATAEQIKEIERLAGAIYDLQKPIEDMGQIFSQATSTLLFGLDNLARSAEDGSTAQRTFAIAAEIANAALGIQAVLSQGGGDPYSAFARMAAMAGIVASLGVNIASISGSGSSGPDLSVVRQDEQGAGGVLGDTAAKSESILRASEITADATSELVGINRGMLYALQALQDGISGAVTKLARGGDADFGALPSVFTPSKFIADIPVIGKLFSGLLGGIIDKMLGGSAKVVDQGVQILGGTLDEIVFQAFQTVKSKKHIFASTKIRDSFVDFEDEVANQFALILGSIGDTVREAALALGLPLDIIEARIAAFEIETQKISLKDLTAEEQEAELLAVFSEIFDGLAGAVVPFIDQFQKVGEGLGETLVRVATSVQVFQEAVDALGLTVDMSDPEKVAQMAVGIAELVGGVENFIAQFSTFFDKFASDEQKLGFVTDQLTRAFEQADLVIPATRDGMIDLMRSLDASTDAGRRQIATLLQLADVADEYYSLLEDAEEDRLQQAEELAQAVRDQVQAVRDFVNIGPPTQLIDLQNRFEDAMKAARSLNASQREYAMITRAFDQQLKRMAAQLMISVLEMSKTLFGPTSATGTSNPVVDTVEEVREVSNALFEDWIRALEDIFEYTQQLLLDEELTTLTPTERLAEAQRQFDSTLAKALAGDVEAAASLPDAAQALLEEARFMFASGNQYQAIFDRVLAQLDSVTMPSGIPEFIREESGGGSTGGGETGPTENDRLIEELQRFLLATDLAVALRELSHVLDVSVIQLADQLGVPLNELVEILGVNLSNLSRETAIALAGVAQLLGADIYELMEALNVGLAELAVASGVQLGMMSKALVDQLAQFAVDLGVNVLDLATRLNISLEQMASLFGVSIESFEASQFQALAQFSAALGAGINDVAAQLGLSLGDIADATSTLSAALDLAIAKLPEGIQADLGPLLDAIRQATTEADARAAIQNLGDYVLDLPDDIGSELIPFLQAIGYAMEQGAELSELQNIAGKISMSNSILSSINNAIGGLMSSVNAATTSSNNATNAAQQALSAANDAQAAANDALYTAQDAARDATLARIAAKEARDSQVLGEFAKGGPVNETGLYKLHANEFVVNPTASNLAVAAPESSQLSSVELAQIRSVLEDIREQNREYQREDIAITKGIESGVKQQAEQDRRRANG